MALLICILLLDFALVAFVVWRISRMHPKPKHPILRQRKKAKEYIDWLEEEFRK